MKYRTIVIDPPWPGIGESFRPSAKGGSKSCVIPYSTMTGIQVAAMRIADVAAEDAQLFLWATSRSIGDAMMLLQLWGFTYRGLFVWLKRLGLGRHMRHEVEFLLWGGRPNAQLVEPKKCPRQVHRWKKPKAHSEKPAEAYQMIALLSPRPRIDIFARQLRPGFTPWGNQAPKVKPQNAPTCDAGASRGTEVVAAGDATAAR